MRKFIFPLILSSIAVFTSVTLFAQESDLPNSVHPTPRWVSSMGYWTIESNIHTPKHHILYFYNNDKVLVYKETMDGLNLNLDKRKTKMRLKKVVEQAVIAFNQKQKVAENEMLVMNQMRK